MARSMSQFFYLCLSLNFIKCRKSFMKKKVNFHDFYHKILFWKMMEKAIVENTKTK